ncbi:hypothetical protein KK083_23170 [Fulvivirgaceae bacterium PWU4]|uniref:STAS/SEC14 domain-containing protein n=1 Tax=Chryseosolibacter histidini TaxID=2782349 RepID=A0AAP2DR50_9BACT|nr:STAS/SEC14 domain-containing protein [Chryseosolibacter histidini]MBT1699808.1 hypothetical protein [Chryseosolibacter histidini]
MSFVESTEALSSLQNMIKPFYKDEYATIELDDSIPCVKLTLNGVPRYSEHYNFVQSKRIELVNREIGNYQRLHLLTDSRTAGPVLDEDVEHFKTHVLPAMEQAGVRYLAIVMPSSKFTQLTIKEMTQHAQVMTIRYFESMREARLWLRKIGDQ